MIKKVTDPNYIEIPGAVCDRKRYRDLFCYAGFNFWTFLANWLKLVCFNFPFAYFTQLFFIQPAVRTIFKLVFRGDIKARAREAQQKEQSGKKLMPENEADAVADIFKRIDEIKEELREEIVESLLESREKN